MTDKDDKRPAGMDEPTPVEVTAEETTPDADAATTAASEAETPAESDSSAAAGSPAGDTGSDRPPIPPRLARDRAHERTPWRSRGVLVALVLVAVVAGVAGALWLAGWGIRDGAVVRPGATAAPDGDELAARLARMEAAVKALQERPYPLPVDDTRLTALERQMKELAAALARLEAGARTEPPPKGPDSSTLALTALAGALDAGRPFAAHLSGARAALAALGEPGKERRAALETIAGRAATGVPTAAMLAARAATLHREAGTALAVAAAAAEKAAETPPPADSLWARIKARIGSLVTIRRIDGGSDAAKGAPAKGAAGKPAPAAPLAAAARLLAEGKVAEAHTALGADAMTVLPPSVRDGADTLRADIDARLAADRVATGAVAAVDAPGAAGDR